MNQIGSTGQEKSKKNNWVTENLLEKVKTVKQTCYEAIVKSSVTIKGRRIDNSLNDDYSFDFENTCSIYNQTGYIDIKYGYMADDRLVGMTNYKYDNNWNLVEVNNYDSENILITNSKYKYDDKQNEIECSSYMSGVIYYKAINKYDGQGNQIETTLFNIDRTSCKNTYKYDDKGNQIEMKRYDSEGRYDSKLIQKYDDNGNMVEFNVYNSDGSVIGGKYTNKFDDKGNLVEKCTYNPDGSLVYKWAYKFDNRRNLIEWSVYESDGRLVNKIAYKYKYDKKGNWIMKICHVDNIPQYIYEREIEYYE